MLDSLEHINLGIDAQAPRSLLEDQVLGFVTPIRRLDIFALGVGTFATVIDSGERFYQAIIRRLIWVDPKQ